MRKKKNKKYKRLKKFTRAIGYTHYDFSIELYAKRLYKDSRKQFKDFSKDYIKQSGNVIKFLKTINDVNIPTALQHIVFSPVTTYEYQFVNSKDKTVYFLEDKGLCDFLMDAKYEVDESVMDFPMDYFIINFPIGFKIGGIQATSALFNLDTPKTRENNYLEVCKKLYLYIFDFDEEKTEKFIQENIIPKLEEKRKEYDDYDENQKTVSVVCRGLGLSDSPNSSFEIDSMYLSVHYNQLKKQMENSRYVYNTSYADNNFGDLLKIEESDYMNDLIRMAAGISIYLKCFPNALRPGLPIKTSILSESISNFPVKKIGAVDKIKFEPGSPVSSHYRRGHFRLLKDDRYVNKKGQAVWVTETFVNKRDEKLYTVESALE